MKPPVAVQLYSVRESAAQDLAGALRRIADMGYVGVEFAGLYDHEPAEVRALLDDLGMVCCSAHSPVPTEETVEGLLDIARTLGYSYHVLGWGPPQFASAEEIQKVAAEAEAAYALLQGTGVKVAVHNHYWEFDHLVDGRYPHEVFMEAAPNMLAELDTYWVKVGGADPATELRKLGARAPLLHIKDGPGVRGTDMLPIGKGIMDWPLVFAEAGAAEWLIVELDSCATDMFEALADSYAYLVGNGYAEGRK